MANIHEIHRTLRALANERRLTITQALAKTDMSVWQIGQLLKCSYEATSKHLQKLRAVGIVKREQRGSEAYYSLNKNEPFVTMVLSKLRKK